MRDTEYAKELATATFDFDSTEQARLERLEIKQNGEVEIRFSWWKDNRMMMRPLDLTEADLLLLFQRGIANQVFTDQFRAALRDLL